MMTLQQLDMNILLWIQEHLRIDALTPFWKVITFLGNAGWFWIVLAVAMLVPKKNTQDRNCSIAFPCSGISDHECTAQEYCCPPETF